MGPFDDTNLASHILRMVPQNWQYQYDLTGAMVPQSVKELHIPPTRLEMDLSYHQVHRVVQEERVTFNDRIPKKYALRSIALSARNMGAHVPPITLQTA
jgi:hypothetical protein